MLSLKIRCMRVDNDKESCSRYTVELKHKLATEILEFGTGFVKLIRAYLPSPSRKWSFLPLLLHLQLFSHLTLLMIPPVTGPMPKKFSLPESLKHLPSPLDCTSFSSQLKHHFPQIRVRSLFCVLTVAIGEKDIFCAALWGSLLLLTKSRVTKSRVSKTSVSKNLETRKYNSVTNYCINKLFMMYAPMFSDSVDALYFWFPSV